VQEHLVEEQRVAGIEDRADDADVARRLGGDDVRDW